MEIMADVNYQIGLISFWASFQEYYKNWIHDVSVITQRAMALPPYLYTHTFFYINASVPSGSLFTHSANIYWKPIMLQSLSQTVLTKRGIIPVFGSFHSCGGSR